VKATGERIGAAGVLLGALLACGKSGDPVRETLDRMVRSANARDLAALSENVSSDFQAADGSARADAEMLVKRYFGAYEILNVSISDVVIEKSDKTARARFRADLSGQPRRAGGLEAMLPTAEIFDFDVRLSEAGGVWRVAWAQWVRAER
jgi:hypothetical protein